MSLRDRQRGRSWSPAGLTGWLFADMLLALSVLFLATSTAGVAERPKPTPTPTPTVRPTPPPTPRPTPQPLGLEKNPKERYIAVNGPLLVANDGTEAARVRHELRHQFGWLARQHRRCGLVLSFGIVPDDSQLGVGNAEAKRVNQLIKTEMPSVFQGAVTRDFHQVANDHPNTVLVDVYCYYR